MLDKRNQKLYKSLRGEYRKYARRLKVTLLDCCKGKDEINETLGDVFSMLAEAQGAGRDFADVIPVLVACVVIVVCASVAGVPLRPDLPERDWGSYGDEPEGYAPRDRRQHPTRRR